jgi:hypothetical protein
MDGFTRKPREISSISKMKAMLSTDIGLWPWDCAIVAVRFKQPCKAARSIVRLLE